MWHEFVERAERKEEPFSVLCFRYNVSRKTGYKWLKRFRALGAEGLEQKSRRPKTSPRKTPGAVIDQVLRLHRENPDWSAARLHERLVEKGVAPIPARSTVALILRRRRRTGPTSIDCLPEVQPTDPNYRWMLQSGPELRFSDGRTGAPAFLVDEATGFMLGVGVLTGRRDEAFAALLLAAFQRYGVPGRVAIPPARKSEEGRSRVHTPTTVWLMRLGIRVDFLAGDHGQADALPAALDAPFRILAQLSSDLSESMAMILLEQLRSQFNFAGQPPSGQAPVVHYRVSGREMPKALAVPEYPNDAEVRLVSEKGMFTFRRRLVHLGRPFAGLKVEVRPTRSAERFELVFLGQNLGSIDLAKTEASHTTSLPLGA